MADTTYILTIATNQQNAEQVKQQVEAATGFTWYIDPNTGQLHTTASAATLKQAQDALAGMYTVYNQEGSYDPATGKSNTTGGTSDTPPNEVSTPPGASDKIPPGATLVMVKNPTGSDTPVYYAVYDYGGVQWAFEIGDKARVTELFGSTDYFDNMQTVSQDGFDSSDYVDAGSIDSELNSTDSFQAQMDRAIRAAGLEDLPSWIKNDPKALAIMGQATSQEWSSGRMWTELSKTDGFAKRFPPGTFDQYKQDGVTIAQAVGNYLQDEQSLRDAIHAKNPNQQLSTDYLAQVMANGWTAQTASSVLAAYQDLAQHPESLHEANLALAAYNLPPLDETGFLNVLTGGGTPDVVEALNTAAAATAIQNAGLEGIDINLLAKVVNDTTQLRSIESYKDVAQSLAMDILQNQRELNFKQMGLTKEDITAAVFGQISPDQVSPTGKTLAETLNLLARFKNERTVAAQGQPGATSYQDQQGNLRIQGFKGL